MYRQLLCLCIALLAVTKPPLTAFENSKTLSKPFLEQNPPGTRPELFAPGIISLPGSLEFSCTISPDGSEFYFTRQRTGNIHTTIMVSHFRNGEWSMPIPASFNSGLGDFGPMFSPDGDRLFFMSWRQNSFRRQRGPDLYFVEKKGSAWSSPRHLGHPFNPSRSFYASISNNNRIYTTDAEHSDIVLVESDGDSYCEYKNLGRRINCPGLDCYPFVAPDESYLIYTSIRTAISEAPCLFISYRLRGGAWSEPKLLETGIENSTIPYVSPDGKYLFFSADRDIYWMDASIIETLRLETLGSAEEQPPQPVKGLGREPVGKTVHE